MSSWGTSARAVLPAGRHFMDFFLLWWRKNHIQRETVTKKRKTKLTGSFWRRMCGIFSNTNVSCFRLMAVKVSHSATCLPVVIVTLWADWILVSTESWRLLFSRQSCCRSGGSFDVTPTHFIKSSFIPLTSDSKATPPPPNANTHTHTSSPFGACWQTHICCETSGVSAAEKVFPYALPVRLHSSFLAFHLCFRVMMRLLVCIKPEPTLGLNS